MTALRFQTGRETSDIPGLPSPGMEFQKVNLTIDPHLTPKEFASFVSLYGYEHVTSSPGYPQSDGKAANAVTATKTLVKKRESRTDPYLAFLELRSIPSEKMKTSCQRLLADKLEQTFYSQKSVELKNMSDVKSKLMEEKKIQSKYYKREAVELERVKVLQERSSGTGDTF